MGSREISIGHRPWLVAPPRRMLPRGCRRPWHRLRPRGSTVTGIGATIVRRNQDADTVAVIAGCLLGARFGDSWVPVEGTLDHVRAGRYADYWYEPSTSLGYSDGGGATILRSGDTQCRFRRDDVAAPRRASDRRLAFPLSQPYRALSCCHSWRHCSGTPREKPV